jgi:hypothetical protein
VRFDERGREAVEAVADDFFRRGRGRTTAITIETTRQTTSRIIPNLQR